MATLDERLDRYVPRTSEDIRYISSGSVKRRMPNFVPRWDWTEARDTLWDQRIFGPLEDWKCACGKFDGQIYVGTVCDICGVRIVTTRARKVRFGHINLPCQIPHPMFPEADPIDAIPVIPTCYWEIPPGEPLANAYDEMLRLSLGKAPEGEITMHYALIRGLLKKIYAQHVEYDEDQLDRVAWGFALKRRPEDIYGTHGEEGEEDVEWEEAPDWENLQLAEDDAWREQEKNS